MAHLATADSGISTTPNGGGLFAAVINIHDLREGDEPAPTLTQAVQAAYDRAEAKLKSGGKLPPPRETFATESVTVSIAPAEFGTVREEILKAMVEDPTRPKDDRFSPADATAATAPRG